MARAGNNNLNNNMADYIKDLEKAIKLMEQLVKLQSDAEEYSNFYANNMSEITKAIALVNKDQKVGANNNKATLETLKQELSLQKEKLANQAKLQAMQEIEIENAKELLNHEKELAKQKAKTKEQRDKTFKDLNKFEKVQTKKINNQSTKLNWNNAGEYFTQNWKNRTEQQLFNDAFASAKKKAYKTKGELDSSAIEESILEEVNEGMNASAGKFKVAAGLIQAGADTFKAGVDVFTNLFKKGITSQTSAFKQNATIIGTMTQTTVKSQQSIQRDLNNQLGSWMPYSSSDDLRDNVATSEIINAAGQLSKIGTGLSDQELYTQALDNVVTNKIVPYLDTGSVLWQQMVDFQPSLQKNIRGITAINNEIAGNNYATSKVVDQVLSDLQPISDLAENELAMTASGASTAINTLIAAGMDEETAVAEYKKAYKQKTQGASILQNGTVAEKMQLLQVIDKNIDMTDNSQLGKQIASNIQTQQNLVSMFGGSYTTGNAAALTTSIGVNSMFGGDTSPALYYGKGGKLEDFDSNKVAENYTKGYEGVIEASDKETQKFVEGLYQTEQEKQEIYMENMVNEVSSILESLGYWGQIIEAAIKGVVDALVISVIGKGIGLLSGAGGSSKGILGALGVGGTVTAAIGLTAATIMGIGAAAKGEYDEMENRISGEIKEELSSSKDPNVKKWADNGAMNQALAGTQTQQQQNWWGETWSNTIGGIKTGWNNIFSSDYIKKNKQFYEWMTSSGVFSEDDSAGTLQRMAAYFLWDKAGSLDSIDSVSKNDLNQIAKEAWNLKGIQSAADALVKAGWAPSDKEGHKVDSKIDFASYGAPAGSYRTGLDTVPYDDYPALLHEGEAVLTASTANELRNLLVEYRETSNQSATIDTAISNQTIALVTKMDEILRTIQNINLGSTKSNWSAKVSGSMKTMTNTKVLG